MAKEHVQKEKEFWCKFAMGKWTEFDGGPTAFAEIREGYKRRFGRDISDEEIRVMIRGVSAGVKISVFVGTVN